MDRRWTIALLGAVAATGCQNMGLDYAGPEEEAQLRPPFDLVASTTAPAAAVEERGLVMDGRLWVPAGQPLARAEEGIQPVGSADGRTVYARGWDEAPYDELFARDEEGWRSYLPVVGGGGPGAGQGGGHGEGQGGDHDEGQGSGHVVGQSGGQSGGH